MTDDLVKRLRELAGRYDEAAERIEKLEAALQRANATAEEYERKFYLGTDRIEKLETALRELSTDWDCCAVSKNMKLIARKALEGKDE